MYSHSLLGCLILSEIRKNPSSIAKFTAYVAAIIAVIFWAGNFTVARFAGFNNDLPPIFLAFSRWSLALLLISPWVTRRMIKERREILASWFIISSCGIFGVAGFSALTYFAAQTTSSVNLSLIAMASPIFTVIFVSIFDRALPEASTVLGFILCAIGVHTVVFGSGIDTFQEIQAGDLWMLGGAFCWGLYTTLVARIRSSVSGLALLGSTTVIGTFILSIAFAFELAAIGQFNLSRSALPVILYIGLFVSVLGYICWNFAIRSIGSVKTGSIYFLIPFFTAAISASTLGETLYASQLLGFIVVLFGIILIREKGAFKRVGRFAQQSANFFRSTPDGN